MEQYDENKIKNFIQRAKDEGYSKEETYAYLSQKFPNQFETETSEETIETPTKKEWDSLDYEIQNFRDDYKDLSPELQSEVRQRYSQMKENQQIREEERKSRQEYLDTLSVPVSFLSGLASASSLGASDLINAGLGLSEYQKMAEESSPVSNIVGQIAGSLAPRMALRKGWGKGLYAEDTFKNIAGRNFLESLAFETPRSLIRQATGVEDKQTIGENIADLGINTAVGTAIESIIGAAGKFYNKYSKNARAMKALGGKDNFKKANEIASKVSPEEQKSIFTREIFSNMSDTDQKSFAKKFLTDESFRKEVSPLLDEELLNNSKIIQDEINKTTSNEAQKLNKNLYKGLKKDLQDVDLTEKGFEKQLGSDNIEYKNLRLDSIDEAQRRMNTLSPENLNGVKNRMKNFGDSFKASANSHADLLDSIDSNSFKSLNNIDDRIDFFNKNKEFIKNFLGKKELNIDDIDLDDDKWKIILNKVKAEQLLGGIADNTKFAYDLDDFKTIINDSVSLENISETKQAIFADLKKGINNILERFSPRQTAVNNVEREIDDLIKIKKAFTDSFDIKGNNVNSPKVLKGMLYKQIQDPNTKRFSEVIDVNRIAAARSGLKALDQSYAITGNNQGRQQLRKFLKDNGIENLLKLDDTDKIFTADLTKEVDLQKTFLNLIKNISPVDDNNWFNTAKAIVAGTSKAPIATFNNVAQVIKNAKASPAVRKTVANIITDYSPGKANAILKSMDPLTQKELSKYLKISLGNLKLIPMQIIQGEQQ